MAWSNDIYTMVNPNTNRNWVFEMAKVEMPAKLKDIFV